MKIAILDLTEHAEPMLSGLPRVGEQIVTWLSPAMPEADIFWVDVAEGGAPMPELDTFDGLVVSGSEHGVYDPLPWMPSLRQLLLDTKEAGKPIFGICFGHQIMADVFGGKAGLADTGVVVGVRKFRHGDETLDTHVWHQDQVLEVPPGAEITMVADHCPIGGLQYDFPAMSVQFHPEYSQTQLRALFKRGRDIFITGDNADQAAASFDGSNVAPDLMSREAATFFRDHITG